MRVIIFGGTGTIGRIIAEAYISTCPNLYLRIFSNSENELWETEQIFGNEKIRYLLGDIRDYQRVKRAMMGVDLVFNCAAIKHVPICEYNPMEAVTVNIIGLDNILRAATTLGIKRVIHISTDKAVEPIGVMGATKLIGEHMCKIRNGNNGVMISCVRLGNVMGSRGSFIQVIQNCEHQNKPIPLTHPEATRYVMSSIEVREFILNCFAYMRGGEIFIPKLEKIKIIDLVKDAQRVDVIGLRPGEKLHEKLFSSYESIQEEGAFYIVS